MLSSSSPLPFLLFRFSPPNVFPTHLICGVVQIDRFAAIAMNHRRAAVKGRCPSGIELETPITLRGSPKGARAPSSCGVVLCTRVTHC